MKDIVDLKMAWWHLGANRDSAKERTIVFFVDGETYKENDKALRKDAQALVNGSRPKRIIDKLFILKDRDNYNAIFVV